MKRLYAKSEVNFAIVWIVIYCVLTIPIRGNYGDDSIFMLIALILVAAGATAFIRANDLGDKYGLIGWPQGMRKYWYFLPLWILVTGNLWGGFEPAYQSLGLLFAVLSMLLVGFVEEVIFRGFLFTALLREKGTVYAVIISSVTFGLGHIVNLFAGQANLETILQVFFAIAWGFIFTMVFYKSGKLLPCIIAHGLVDIFSKFSADSTTWGFIYMGATIITALIYCTYLAQLPSQKVDTA